MKFASDSSSIPLICWYTSDTCGSVSILFLLVLFVVTPLFAFLVAWWTLSMETLDFLAMLSSPEVPLMQTSSEDRAVCSLRVWVTWGWGVLVSWVSAAFTHLPPLTPGRSPPASPSGSLGCLPWPPPFSAGPEAHRLSPERHKVIDTQRSAGLGRVLGMFSVPPFSWGA